MQAKFESEEQLNQISSHIASQQENIFSSLTEAQNHLKKIKSELRQLVDHGNKSLVKGLTYLAENEGNYANDYVASVCAKLLKHRHSSKKLNKIIESEILRNENALLFFAEAIDNLLGYGDLEREHCTLTVMMVLFPLNPQPYIYMGSSIWKNDGIEAAATFYTEVLKVLPEPAIYYFAAELFIEKGDKAKGRELLGSALEQARKSPERYAHLEPIIAGVLQKS